MRYPLHGLRMIDGDKTRRPVSITLDVEEWIDVLDALLEARNTNQIFARNYSSTVNTYHRRKARRDQELFDAISEAVGQ